ncbi:MAG: YlbF family regulator [Lactobacillales bacterium]|jgi:cell fate (sporulation/competence/biofilm development) regulator YmcA (YheA/YmcA/DUF963 family)|nr:YlbF family regulator [Lactobacillales bacterium]
MENKEILGKLNELLILIEQDVAVQEFKEIEQQVESCSEVQSLMQEIKNYQQISAQADHHGHEKNKEITRKQAENLRKMLDGHPLIKEYREKMWEANDLVQHVISFMEEEIRKQIER